MTARRVVLFFAIIITPIFCFSQSSVSISTLGNFCDPTSTCPGGYNPSSQLIAASDGNFYGIDSDEGRQLFRLSPTGAITTVLPPCSGTVPICINSGTDFAQFLEGLDGNLYIPSGDSILKVTFSGVATDFYKFCSVGGSSCLDGDNVAVLNLGSDGNLYGLTDSGGSSNAGTFFKINPAGALTTIYNFCSGTGCPSSFSSLVQGSDGNFYGTSEAGGAHNDGQYFKITPSGSFTDVHDFCSGANCDDGDYPIGLQVEGADGNFYGITQYGGLTNALAPSEPTSGLLYKASTAGGISVIHDFCSGSNCSDGLYPEAGVYLASDGYFYGTTTAGGSVASGVSSGVLYRASSTNYSNLHDFCQLSGCSDGLMPIAPPIQGNGGNLFGTTSYGGVNGYVGIAYKGTFSPTISGPIVLTASPNSITYGHTSTISWATSNAYSDSMNECEGFVNNTPYATVNGTGSQIIVPSAAGVYSLAITCGGIESGYATLTVNKGTTATAASAIPNPVAQNAAIALSATVTRTGGGSAPTGSVSFYYNGAFVGSAMLSGGTATYNTTANVPKGTYSLTAVYSGSSGDNGSTSPPVNVVVD